MSAITDWNSDRRFSEYRALFNRWKFFEAHEVLEALWLEVRGDDRELLQGLIQIAVALAHRARGNPKGALKVFRSAERRLERYGDRCQGIPLADLKRRTGAYLMGRRKNPPAFPPPKNRSERPRARARPPMEENSRNARPRSGARPARAAHRKGSSHEPGRAKTRRPPLGPLMVRRQRTLAILERLRTLYPDARCELEHKSALELLIATILSAQCTDVRVNMTTPALFARYRTAADYAAATPSELERLIRPTGFYRNKTKSIIALGEALVQKHGGAVPDAMDDLVLLPGVGRKTANVLLAEWYGRPGIAVDTHVIRLTGPVWRLTDETDPVKIEFALYELIPEKDRAFFGIATIFHGRRICSARSPNCAGCLLSAICPSAFVAAGTRDRATARTSLAPRGA